MTPGVPSFAAAAAALGRELTIPEVAQSLVLTRISGRASKMPPRRNAGRLRPRPARRWRSISPSTPSTEIVAELTPLYGADCPVAIVFRASWPDERILRGTLADIEAARRRADRAHGDHLRRPRRLAAENFRESSLYDADYQRRFRGATGMTRHPHPGWNGLRNRSAEIRVAHQLAVAVEDQHFELDFGALQHAGRRLPGALGDRPADRNAGRRRLGKGLRHRVGAAYALRPAPRRRRPQTRPRPARRDRPGRAWSAGRACPAPAWSSWRRRRRR